VGVATADITVFGLSTGASAAIIQGVTGSLFAASLSGFGAALEGQSPNQIEEATGNPYNIALGALTAIGGAAVSSYRLGAYALAIISVGGGGWQAYSEYQQGNYAAAVYYGTLGTLGGVLSAAVPYLRGSTQTPPTVDLGSVETPPALKGPNQSVEPTSLSEQLILEEAEANAYTIIDNVDLGDAPRLEANYGGGEWVKMKWTHQVQGAPTGVAGQSDHYVIHFFRNLDTGESVEFKFKNR
jgi:hypothetical protein